ncbi:MAG TPA: hypothetical protein VGP25_14660, partial [Gemmatimonadaceae bacterium]|nr:hypothetical protein [Gemmatimonadaceae bacterium]
NALLAAAAWCDAKVQPPEESLFWKTWIRAGTNTLLPRTYPGPEDWGYGEQGILARTYFQRVAFPLLKSVWDSLSTEGRWRSGCNVPVGATVTRLESDTVQLTSSIRARNLHMASTFDVHVGAGRQSQYLSFRARAGDRQRPEVGRILGMPTRRDATIALDTLFRLFAASSGYPVLFAPQQVLFVADSGIYPCGAAPKACNTSSALFVDGGVFDNGPLALGLDLYYEGGLSTQKARGVPHIPFVLYVAPDSRRQFGDPRTEALPGAAIANARKVGGLAGGFKLLSAAIPAAREYEIQSLVRQLRTASDLPDSLEAKWRAQRDSTFECMSLERCFIAPERWHPLMGDRMYGFGGFLARPFREYDFYVGIYDALVLTARYVARDSERRTCESGRASQELRGCVQQRLRGLLESPMQLGVIAPCVLWRLYAAEFEPHGAAPEGERRTCHCPTPACVVQIDAQSAPADSALGVLVPLSDAMGRLMHDTLSAVGFKAAFAQEHCGVEGPLHGILCSEGLLSIADALQSDKPAMAILERWNKDPSCADDLSPDQSADCLADSWFLSWIHQTRRETHFLLKNALKRLDETTPHGTDGNIAAVAAVHALSLAFLSASETYRFGVDLGQTSLPQRGSKLSTAGWELVPSSLSFPLTSAGVIFGWEARFVFHGHYSVVLPGKIAHSSLHAVGQPESNHWYGLPGVGFGVVPYPGMHLPGFISGVRPEVEWWMGGGDDAKRFSRERMAYGVTTFLVSNKLRFSVMHQPDLFDRQPTAHLMYQLGIHDVNGLAYWIKHLNGH